ncbi:hypothetical protein ES704_03413 [subsurface metagenome]
MWLQIEIPKPPYRHLKKQLPEVDSNIRFLIPIMLDKMSVERLAAGVIQCPGAAPSPPPFCLRLILVFLPRLEKVL